MFQEEGYRLMGAAFEVYNQLGYGLAEDVSQESLEIELELRDISFRKKTRAAVETVRPVRPARKEEGRETNLH